jgi:hypothetical protein
MSKHVETPTSRLICFGGAKLRTNAVDINLDEQEPGLGFGE